jgi:uncharacterized membrane protein YhaH (DUF805 family)
MGSYFDGMLRYFEVSGRSTRMQYWMFFLIHFVLLVLAVVADYQLGGFARPRSPQLPLTLFVVFVHVIPAITLSVRRLHDIGKSGAWYLLNFVPFGGAVLFFWACCPSQSGSNLFDGPAPSNYEPRGGRPPRQAHTTIPRVVRMGSGATRPPVPSYDGLSAPERFI